MLENGFQDIGAHAAKWKIGSILALTGIFLLLYLHVLPLAAQDLLRMNDHFDQLDKNELAALLAKADQCTKARDFVCSESKLREARKLATDSKNKVALNRSEAAMASEKERVREEQRVIAQHQRDQERELEEAELQRRMAERRARDAEAQAQAEADEQANLAARVAAAGNLYAQNIRSQAANRAAEQARLQQAQQSQAEVAAATARDQQRFARERAQLAQNHIPSTVNNRQVEQTQQTVSRTPVPEPETRKQAARTPSINTGQRAMQCVSVTRDKDDVGFTNTCSKQIFVVWCGNSKYTKKKCGDGPAGNSYYTHSVNVGPGDTQYARGLGEYHYAACEGGIAFGKDEIQDRPDGSFTCVPR